MTTRAADHLHVIKQIALRRTPRSEMLYRPFVEGQVQWSGVLDCAKHLQLPDGSLAVHSMVYGKRINGIVFGRYTGYTRHIEIASSQLTETVFGTCLHEMAHALLHSDVQQGEANENEAWLECEADVTADLVRMMLGYSPRSCTQWRLAAFGNYGDLVAFFFHAGPACIEAAQQIYSELESHVACTQVAIRVA